MIISVAHIVVWIFKSNVCMVKSVQFFFNQSEARVHPHHLPVRCQRGPPSPRLPSIEEQFIVIWYSTMVTYYVISTLYLLVITNASIACLWTIVYWRSLSVQHLSSHISKMLELNSGKTRYSLSYFLSRHDNEMIILKLVDGS